MDYCGIDLHKKESQIQIRSSTTGEVTEQRIATSRGAFEKVFGGRPRTKILLESSTESEWVARCLEGLGHEVIVADPNFAPMYAYRNRKAKSDKRDAEALAVACELGAHRPAHRTSDEQRHVRARLAVREALVRTRSRYISLARALLRREGLRVAKGEAEHFSARVDELVVPGRLKSELGPLLAAMQMLNEQIAFLDETITRVTRSDEQVGRLTTAPGVGPVTAAAFVSVIDTPERFATAHEVEAYLGLVPREMSSGESERKGAITKAGNGRARWLLVQSAWTILRLDPTAQTERLHTWASKLAARRGKNIAVVALARRLAGILFAMMRDKTTYQARPATVTTAPSKAA